MSTLTVDRALPARSAAGPCGLVRVLDQDPDLGLALAADEWELAARAAIAPVFAHDCGTWRFFPAPDRAALGALVLAGLIVVRIEVDGRAHLELLGPGDVISPWAGMGPDLAVPSVVSARVVSDLRLALLDRGFSRRIARWPEIHAALMQRLITRARRLSLQSAINGITRIEERLELTLWQLAYRFGKVTPSGFCVELPVTHKQLADMVAAQRPSVTMALAGLAADGRLVRQSRTRWLLRGPAPAKLSALAQQSGLHS